MACGDFVECHDEDNPCGCDPNAEDNVPMSYNPRTGQWNYIYIY